MTPQQAIKYLHDITSLVPTTREQHNTILGALVVLQKAVESVNKQEQEPQKQKEPKK